MTDPAELLDQLDAARENAAVGSLRVGEHYGIHLYAGENPVGTTLRASDAALIVAAVNALPALIAAVRAAADLADENRGRAKAARSLASSAPDAHARSYFNSIADIAEQTEARLHTALAAALPEGDAPA